MVNPTTAMNDAPMSGLANLMAMKGRENDSMLVHLSPSEVSNLNKLSGNTMTINPATGLPEGRSRLLEAVLPALLSIGVGIATGGASIPAQMAAQAAAGYGGSRLMGKEHEEALTHGLVSGATAGLFGGVGSDALAGGRELGRAGAVEGAKTGAIQQGTGLALKSVPTTILPKAATEQMTKDLALREASKQAGNWFSPYLSSSGDVYGQIASDMAGEGGMSLGKALTQPQTMKGLTGILGKEAGVNAMINQMRSDANRLPPPGPEGAEEIDIYSQPYSMNLQGPFSESDVTGAFLGDNITPINYYDQGYGKEGGSVQHMAQGGLAGLPVRMLKGGDILKAINIPYGLFSLLKGRKKSGGAHPTGQPTGQPLQLGNPIGGVPISPPLPADIFEQAQQANVHMAFGGDLGNYIPSVAIINSLMCKLGSDKKSGSPTTTHNYYGVGPDGKPIQVGNPMPQQMAFGGGLGKLLGVSGRGSTSSPRGSSQGGKGSGVFRKLLEDPEVIAALQQGQKQPEQRMERGGAVGTVKDWATELKNRFYGSQIMDPFMRMVGKDPSKYMAGGGMMGDIPPELLAKLKEMSGQASAPAPKAYDQLAALGQNPMQQMQGGGLTGAAEASGSMMPALQPLLQVASEEALQAVNQPRTYAEGGQPFEGQVRGRGDGMSDQIPFNIEGQQPALLSRDEYVVPADVVAMVGDGSSNAGADQFDNFIGDIRQMKYGRQVQPREINRGLGSLLGVA